MALPWTAMAFAMRRGEARNATGTGGDTRPLGDDDPRIVRAWRSLQQSQGPD